MHTFVAIILTLIFLVVLWAVFNWMFSNPVDTSEDWIEDEEFSFNTPGIGLSTFEMAALGATTAAILTEETENEKTPPSDIVSDDSDIVSDDEVSTDC